MIATIFIPVFAQNLPMLLAGNFINGEPPESMHPLGLSRPKRTHVSSKKIEKNEADRPGIPWGIFQTLTTAYAAEICPMALRAHLTSFVNICWASGESSTSP